MKQIVEHIKSGAFQQFYLLMGDENYLKKQYKEKLAAALVDVEDSMNYHYAEGNNLDMNQICDLGETLPFFSERRVLVLENTGLLKKSSKDVEEKFANFPESTYVIMIEEDVDKRNSLYKFFAKQGYVANLTTPDEKTLLQWVKTLCKEEGKIIEDAAVFHLTEHMGTEMFLLKNELEKLFCYCQGRNQITVADVNEICLDEAEDKLFDMLDAIGNRNQKKALKLYRDLLELHKPPMQLLTMLSRHFNILLQMSALKETGTAYADMASLCGVPPFTVKKYVAQTSAYSYERLKAMVERCQMTDQEIKTGVIKDVVGVELLIVEFSGN